MTVTDQSKILNRKIKQSESQYDLDRKAAEISALSSKNLDKYEYLTGEDLGLKPSTVEQAKFEYSPLGKVFIKGLDKEDKKEGLFKRLKNIKDKNEELIKAFSKAPKNKASNEENKNLVYNSQHSFAKFKDIDGVKELSLDSMHKTLNNFNKKFTNLKNLIPCTKANKKKKKF